jgi:hypothetical protein
MTEAKTNTRKAWEQLEGESNQAFAQFLAYRNLGPARSVLSAYASTRLMVRQKEDRPTQSPPKAWWENYRVFQWKDRATAWDVWQLPHAVPEAAVTIFKLIGETAKVCLTEIANGNIKPQSFAELKEMVVILGSFISPEVVSTTLYNAGDSGAADAQPVAPKRERRR